MRQALVAWVVGLGIVALPVLAAAQSATSGAISGVVKDATGAVLPGVTVEVASPALIEKVRSTVTDSQGNYKVTDLRPGTYSVTFTLGGFSAFKREGIELTTGFTAPANADLKVGSLSETVTVTGASPVVDIQNTRSQNVLTSDVLNALPTNKAIQGFASATVGMSFQLSNIDVGGNRHEAGVMTINGGPSMKTTQDGMAFNSAQSTGDGQLGSYAVNLTGVQEVALELGGMGAESQTGGVNINYVPKDGGNNFSGTVDLEFANGALQSSNLNDRIRARGLTTATEAKKLYDYAEGLGGPIKRDRLWFFHTARWWGSQEYQPGNFFNSVAGKYIGSPNSGVSAYVADPTRRAFVNSHFSDYTLRLTWQAAAKHKMTFSGSYQDSCICYQEAGANVAPEASANISFTPVVLVQSTWSHPATNRLLFEAGGTLLHNNNDNVRSPGTSELDIVTIESLGTATVPGGYRYNNVGTSMPCPTCPGLDQNASQSNLRASVSYIPGSHALKVGFQGLVGRDTAVNDFGPLPVNYTLRAGVPTQITQFASPHYSLSEVRTFAVYAQDQWKIRRLTLNLGARFDHYHGVVPEQVRPAGPFVAEIRIPAVSSDALPHWNSATPRFGAAYDLFGNGKTAIKGSIGKFLASVAAGSVNDYNPAVTISTSATRTWADANGNFVPDCDLTSTTANGECGARSNSNFGRSVVNTQRDPALLTEGRGYNWQAQLSISHELRGGWGVEGAYNRTWYGNFTVTDNQLVTPADYDPYCVTAPSDARLPGGGGYPICGLYDLKPAKFGQVSNVVSLQQKYGERSQVYNGARVTSNMRFSGGVLLTTGLSIGRTVTDNCAVVDSPEQTRFCTVAPPWEQNWQFKMNGVYPLPWLGLQTAAVFQLIPGGPINATRSFTNAEIAPSLGRNLAACPATGACTATVNITLYQNAVTLFEPKIKLLDWRLTKRFRFGTRRLEASFDLFNLLNSNAVQASSATFGPSWQRPTAILAGRTARLGVQFDF